MKGKKGTKKKKGGVRRKRGSTRFLLTWKYRTNIPVGNGEEGSKEKNGKKKGGGKSKKKKRGDPLEKTTLPGNNAKPETPSKETRVKLRKKMEGTEKGKLTLKQRGWEGGGGKRTQK